MRKVLRLNITTVKHGYLVRADGDARSAWDGTDIVADGTLNEVLEGLRQLIPMELGAAHGPVITVTPARPVAVPAPAPEAAK